MEPHWSRRTADRRRPDDRAHGRLVDVAECRPRGRLIPHFAAVRRASADSSYRASTVRTTNAFSSRRSGSGGVREDQPGVDAPTQHDTHRDIAPEAEPNCVGEPGVDLVEERLACGRDRLGQLWRSRPRAHARRDLHRERRRAGQPQVSPTRFDRWSVDPGSCPTPGSGGGRPRRSL